jgi:hypothetical protein
MSIKRLEKIAEFPGGTELICMENKYYIVVQQDFLEKVCSTF